MSELNLFGEPIEPPPQEAPPKEEAEPAPPAVEEVAKPPSPQKPSWWDRNPVPEPAERSIALRIISLLITTTCLVAASAYTHVPLFLGFLYVWFAITGSYVSYFFLDTTPKWMKWVIFFGLAAIMTKFGHEIVVQYTTGKFDILSPLIHVLAGLLVLQTFELRARSEINLSTLIAFLLFALTAVLGRDLIFGFYVLGLIVLSTILLYFESVSRTKAGEGGLSLPPAIVRDQPQRAALGSALLPICAMPALALFLFLNLPRVDSLFDLMAGRFHFSPIKLSDPRLSGLAGGGLTGGIGHNPKGDGQDGGGGTGGKGADGENGKKAGADGKGGSKAANDKRNGGGGGLDQGEQKGKGAGKEEGTDKNKAGAAGDTAKNQSEDDKKTAAGKDGTADDQETSSTMGGGGRGKPRPRMTESDDLIFRDKKAVAHDNDIYLTVRTNRLVFLKRMVYDYYDGQRWRASLHGKPAVCERLNGEWSELGGVPSLFVSANFRAEEIPQEITCEIPMGQVIPAAYVPQRIDIGREKVTVDDYGILRCPGGLPEDITFRIISKVPQWDLNQLRGVKISQSDEDSARQKFPNYLQLPPSLPKEVKDLAQKIGQDESTWFGKAERICKYLRYHYKYSMEPYQEDKEHDLVADFLFHKKQGACGEFSSSFVVMCRTLGIPARCVGGYSPGSINQHTGARQIRGKDGHALGGNPLARGWLDPLRFHPHGHHARAAQGRKSLGVDLQDDVPGGVTGF